jgi:uncharacterized membrane protein
MKERVAPSTVPSGFEVQISGATQTISSPIAPDNREHMSREREYYNKYIFIISKDFKIFDMVIRRVHVLEALTIFAFLLSEFMILILYATIASGCIATAASNSTLASSSGLLWYQNILISIGYGLLFFGIFVIVATISLSLRDAVYLYRIRPIDPINNVDEMVYRRG